MPAGPRIVNLQYLVETEWLAAHLADPELRIFDCTTFLDPDPVKIFLVRSGRPEWEQDSERQMATRACCFCNSFPQNI